ncbi:hypothetical protein SDC9_198562 [bioreactor metagenome]|uniref:Uncharacterized protein n=1 Tax=bioreactor metagenome TaxID=1076179 RepID=A0A645IJ95_9ZZZZ
MPGKKRAHGFDLVEGDPLHFDGQAGGHGHLAAAEPLGGLRDGVSLLRGDLAVAGDDAAVKTVRGPLVV